MTLYSSLFLRSPEQPHDFLQLADDHAAVETGVSGLLLRGRCDLDRPRRSRRGLERLWALRGSRLLSGRFRRGSRFGPAGAGFGAAGVGLRACLFGARGDGFLGALVENRRRRREARIEASLRDLGVEALLRARDREALVVEQLANTGDDADVAGRIELRGALVPAFRERGKLRLPVA